MANRGAWSIAAMFGVGLLLAGGSVLYHSGQGRRCLAFYGADDAATVRHAPKVEAWRLEPPAESDSSPAPAEASAEPAATEAGAEPTAASDDTITVDGRPWRIARRVDISQARGLVHARHALIVDANYRWDAADRGGRWTNALTFTRDGDRVVLLFDFGAGQVRELDATSAASLVPTIAAAEQALIEREFTLADRR